jgi:hypothetical protein
MPEVLRRWVTVASALAAALLATPASAQGSAQGNRCAQEAASIHHAQAQLPKLEVAPPDDQQIVCITLETNILFARRMAAHLAHCPRSPYTRTADSWERTGAQYTAQFSDRRCKPAIRPFRG